MVLGLLLTMAVTATALGAEIILDPKNLGRVFDGLGAVSAGASSRLLIEYPEPQRGEILDYLFKPGFGASVHTLKVEIGGGVDSTDGVEATHMRTRDDENYERGYEWWLAKEAKSRNPGIILECLPWGAPAWIGGGNYYSQDMCDYICNFLQGAKTHHGIDFEIVGTHNETAPVPSWIKLLRATLDARGFRSVKIVAADECCGRWDFVVNKTSGIVGDTSLAAAVGAIGVHYPGSYSPAEAQSIGLPLWASEDGGYPEANESWPGAAILGQRFNRNYLLGRYTRTEIWSLVTSYCDILPAPKSGLMRANTPWSGNYEVGPAIWIMAHTTQFATPGWRYLDGNIMASLPSGGTMVGLLSTNGVDYSLVLDTIGASAAQSMTFRLTNGISDQPVRVWKSDQHTQFTQLDQVVPKNGVYSYTLDPNSFYTLTTTSGQGKGTTIPPAPADFPLPYGENFNVYPTEGTPRYFSDQAGLFEVASRPDGQRRCLRQIMTGHGIQWMPEWNPYTIVGDLSLGDYEVSADVKIDSSQGMAAVMGRITSVQGFQNPIPQGYWLAIDQLGRWSLNSPRGVIASGSSSNSNNGWHGLRLAMMGRSITCYVDGVEVVNVFDSDFTAGPAGLACGWHPAFFDNFQLRPTHGIRIQGGVNLAASAVAKASSTWENGSTYGALRVNDGSFDTRWNSVAGTFTNEWIELDWPAVVRFNRTEIFEFGHRIANYRIQHWDGANWLDDVHDQGIGELRRNVFSAVASTKLRLFLDPVPVTPSLFEFQVFFDPAFLGTLGSVRINEWMTGNTKTLLDPVDGGFHPWFELYNTASTNVDLSGYFLSSSPLNLNQFTIPSGTVLKPSQSFLVWTDGHLEANRPGSGALHVSFSLRDSQFIALSSPDGELLDAVRLRAQSPDASSGSLPDGDPAITELPVASPGKSNSHTSILGAIGRVNEYSVELRFKGIPFASHRIQEASDLSGTIWRDIAQLSADSTGAFQYLATNNPIASQRFYRTVTP